MAIIIRRDHFVLLKNEVTSKSYKIYIPDIDVPFCNINKDIQRHINYGLELIFLSGTGQNGEHFVGLKKEIMG